ncbi:MAG: bifunctional response regulator/alkaline phosphatase family protein [Bacteroidales bacterium]
MKKERILWADDEIDLLKPHILFLEMKGYELRTVTNGRDAIDLTDEEHFDLIILDENMPGITGLETLSKIKEKHPSIPVVMITKSEEEDIMNQAIGGKIADYLIKPVNPNQILLSIKKNLHTREIISEKNTSGYQQDFGKISMMINDAREFEAWSDIYKKLVFWELELENADRGLMEMLKMQKTEANAAFCKFVKKNYENWLHHINRPLMSPDLFKDRIFPILDKGEKVFVVLIDNFRLDQWRTIKPILNEYFNFEEDIYCSILPTATQYARNAIFSGLMPDKIATMFPELWVDEDEEEGKNLNEAPLIQTQLDRFRKKYPFAYYKVNESSFGEKLVHNFSNIENNPLNIVVLNFIDMLSHARTESKMIRELAASEAAYRALTKTWLEHSSTIDLFRKLAEKDYKVILTTDHGTIRVDNPVKVVGDRNTNTNLRYKIGKNLSYNPKQVYEVKSPEKFGLPILNVSSGYIFAMNRDFLAYPNNYNYYAGYYKDTFQHGGISMEEMLIPFVVMDPKHKK